MPPVINYRFKLRRGTAAQWQSTNGVLYAGEMGLETDTGRIKVGDGTTAWNLLPYEIAQQYSTDPIAAGQGYAYDPNSGLMIPADMGKTYQAGTGIEIANPDSDTPTVSSTLGSIAVTNDVADYASLPTNLTTADAGQYWVTRDTSMAYRWSGSAWPTEGNGIKLGSGSPSTIPDPYASNVVSLLHLDQPVTDTAVMDSAGITTWAAQGSAYFSPSKSRWGKTSCYINRGLKSAANAALVLGTDDFTIEMLINPYSLGGSPQYGRFFQIGPDTQDGAVSGGLYLYRYQSQDPCQVRLQGCSGSAYFDIIDTVDYATGTYVSSFNWHHVALCRQAGEFLLFINGLLVARNTPATYDITYNYFVLGGNSVGGEFLTGYYNEVRITKGVARYVDDFDLPNGPFANPT